MTVTAADYSARASDERRLETAIARRNTTWTHYRAAAELLRAAELRYTGDELVPYRRNYNEAQDQWERAVYDLQRERRAFALDWGRRHEDDEDDPDPAAAGDAPWSNREGQPEFNGAFR